MTKLLLLFALLLPLYGQTHASTQNPCPGTTGKALLFWSSTSYQCVTLDPSLAIVGNVLKAAAAAPAVAPTPATPTFNLFTPAYIESSASPNAAQLAPWIDAHFRVVSAGTLNLAPVNGNPTWNSYVDSAIIYADQVYQYVDAVAAAHGWVAEDILLHADHDYAIPAALQWSGLDQFDYFEQPNYQANGPGSPSQAVNGAFLFDGTHYTDVTVQLYQGPLTTITNTLYLGYARPFDQINIDMAINRVGGSVAWQYWTGSAWAALPLAADITDGFAAIGTVTFPPPANWALSVVNGSRSKYWVRAVLTGQTTSPAVFKIYGDNWLASLNGNNARGWSATDSHRINVDTPLEYNPTPPANATARFRYQARSTGESSSSYNSVMGNVANVQGGQHTWATAMVAVYQAGVAASNAEAGMTLGFNAGHFDDGGTLAAGFTDQTYSALVATDLAGADYHTADAANIAAARADLQAIYGSSFKVLVNSSDITLGGDNVQYEGSGNSMGRSGNIAYAEMDQYTPGSTTNPLGAMNGLFGTIDSMQYGGADNSDPSQPGAWVNFPWDLGNRAPILYLATFAICANPNTYFSYDSYGFYYNENVDSYYPLSATGTTLTSAIPVDTVGAQKAFTVASDANLSSADNDGVYTIYLGNSDWIAAYKDSALHYHTSTPVFAAYPSGTAIASAYLAHLAVDGTPKAQVWRYANYFPAMSVDLGPIAQAGPRNLSYLNGGQASGDPANCVDTANPAYSYCGEIWTRVFPKAVIFAHVRHDGDLISEMNVYGPLTPIQLGGTYYPLLATGKTGPGVTSIQLRENEAFIGMKSPIN